jgi:Tol biopolymer transport system component
MMRHNARIAYLDWLDEHTLIYSGAAEDSSGQWLYAMVVRRRVPHRVSPGISEQYLSVTASSTRPRHLLVSVANPSAGLWTVPLGEDIQIEAAANRLPVPKSRALSPRFAAGSPLFLSSTDGRDGLWKLENGMVSELWKGSEGGVTASPSISPDGREICFSYRKRGRTGLHLMSADGTNIRALASSLDVSGAASWSPDSRCVAVAANEGEGTYVFKVPVDGGTPVRMVNKFSYSPVWSPDGKFLIYSEPLQGGASVTKAMRPDKTAVPFPAIQLEYTTADPYHFVQGGEALIVLKGGSSRQKNFYWLDLETGSERVLTDLKSDSVIQHFDITPDGQQIVFDRVRNNSDLFLLDLRQ